MRFIPLDRVGELERELAREIAGRLLIRRRDAIATALGLHGLRVREVSNATAADFSPALRRLHVHTIKGGVPRDVPLHPSLADALVAWRKDMGLAHGKGPLLPTRKGKPAAPTQFRRFACPLMKRLYGEPFRFHALRHTFAMRVLAQHRDVMVVKKYLGHRSLKATLVYVEALEELNEACLVNLDSPFFAGVPGAVLRVWAPEEREEIVSLSS